MYCFFCQLFVASVVLECLMLTVLLDFRKEGAPCVGKKFCAVVLLANPHFALGLKLVAALTKKVLHTLKQLMDANAMFR